MSRIAATFTRLVAARRCALIPFITAGDPAPKHTVALMQALVAGGADIIELGVPFSDPMADGPTIQRASERALAHGVSLRDVLGLVAEFRRSDARTPVVLMGYANPIEALGLSEFAASAQTAGVDGVLVVDYPPEEAAEYAQAMNNAALDAIFLLAPTSTPERVSAAAKLASGYLYYVSLKGVTGAGHIDLAEVSQRIPALRALSGLPVGVGFGVRDGQIAARIAEFADAVVIGSRLIEEIEQSPAAELPVRVRQFMRTMRAAIDEAAQHTTAK